jgi:hypothetical protein
MRLCLRKQKLYSRKRYLHSPRTSSMFDRQNDTTTQQIDPRKRSLRLCYIRLCLMTSQARPAKRSWKRLGFLARSETCELIVAHFLPPIMRIDGRQHIKKSPLESLACTDDAISIHCHPNLQNIIYHSFHTPLYKSNSYHAQFC